MARCYRQDDEDKAQACQSQGHARVLTIHGHGNPGTRQAGACDSSQGRAVLDDLVAGPSKQHRGRQQPEQTLGYDLVSHERCHPDPAAQAAEDNPSIPETSRGGLCPMRHDLSHRQGVDRSATSVRSREASCPICSPTPCRRHAPAAARRSPRPPSTCRPSPAPRTGHGSMQRRRPRPAVNRVRVRTALHQHFHRGRRSKPDRPMERRDAILVGLVHIRPMANEESNHGALHPRIRIMCRGGRDEQAIQRDARLERGAETLEIESGGVFGQLGSHRRVRPRRS